MEQNMFQVIPFLGRIKAEVQEMPDHLVAPAKTMGMTYIMNYKHGLLIFPFSFLSISISAGIFLSNYLMHSKKTVNDFWEEQKKKGKRECRRQETMTLTLKSETLSLFHELPPVVELELTERKQPVRYSTAYTARSAYMAEFVRNLPGKEHNLLVGGYHAPEIAYFLERGVKEPGLVALAQQHVSLSLHEKNAYASPLRKIKRRETIAGITGFISGLGTSIYALSNLF